MHSWSLISFNPLRSVLRESRDTAHQGQPQSTAFYLYNLSFVFPYKVVSGDMSINVAGGILFFGLNAYCDFNNDVLT